MSSDIYIYFKSRYFKQHYLRIAIWEIALGNFQFCKSENKGKIKVHTQKVVLEMQKFP